MRANILLARLASWLERPDPLPRPEAILVLDGAEYGHRMAAALHLFHQGVAPRLMVSRGSRYEDEHHEVDSMLGVEKESIDWVLHEGYSTRHEALAVREALLQRRCRSVLIVTSSYHTRRARLLFQSILGSRGVRIGTYPVRVSWADPVNWWTSQAGRASILTEYVKLLFAWLHLDLPVGNSLRYRLKRWVLRTIP